MPATSSRATATSSCCAIQAVSLRPMHTQARSM
jgi:hypothetical protein